MGGGWGDQEAENRADALPSSLRALEGGTGTHAFSKVTQTLVRMGREGVTRLQPTPRLLPQLSSPQ